MHSLVHDKMISHPCVGMDVGDNTTDSAEMTGSKAWTVSLHIDWTIIVKQFKGYPPRIVVSACESSSSVVLLRLVPTPKR